MAEPTIGDRIEEAFRLAYRQASDNSNLGELNAYRINRIITLIEQERATAREEGRREERERCAEIITQWLGLWSRDRIREALEAKR